MDKVILFVHRDRVKTMLDSKPGDGGRCRAVLKSRTITPLFKFRAEIRQGFKCKSGDHGSQPRRQMGLKREALIRSLAELCSLWLGNASVVVRISGVFLGPAGPPKPSNYIAAVQNLSTSNRAPGVESGIYVQRDSSSAAF